MKYMIMFILLLGSALGQISVSDPIQANLPDTPKPQIPTCHAWCTFNPQTGLWDRPMDSNKNALKDWKMWASFSALIGANAWDIYETQKGISKGCAVERNTGNPRPSTGNLVAKDIPIDLGISALAFLLRKSRIPIVPEGMMLGGAAIHIHGAVQWIQLCD